MAIKESLIAAAVLATTTLPAMAQTWLWWLPTRPPVTPRPPATTVPEIDVTSAALAVAAVLAALAFAWERSRRRA